MPYVDQILSFGKENLLDILHFLVKEVAELTGITEARVYIEDMREGALVCLYTPLGELERKGARIPIERRDNSLVRAYLESLFMGSAPLAPGSDDVHSSWHASRGISRAALFPLSTSGHAIGVLSLDAPEGPAEVLTPAARVSVAGLLASVMPVLSLAHRFHQQIMLSRSLDRSRKRDAARLLLAGAFKLELALDMTSVLLPAATPVPEALRQQRGGYMEILAAVSREPADLAVYETLERISLLEGRSLLSRLVMQDGDRVVKRPGAQDPLFFEDIMSENFERWEVFNRLGVRTLLMIPVTDQHGSVICVINYFTKRPHRYSEAELNLLRSHTQAVGSGIAETGEAPVEIRILAEIEELLSAEATLPNFLKKVVSMVVELIGAESGSIALVQERDQEKWLAVEDSEATDGLVGAKSRGWRKANIPRLRIGGEELPRAERSLTGYVAHTGKPFLCNDTQEEAARGGFYRELVPQVRSELAVPIAVGETIIGVINLDSYEKGFFTPEHQRILLLISRLIANRIADQLKIAILTQKVSRLRREVSYKDPGVQSYLVGNIIGKSEASRRLVERLRQLTVPLTNRMLTWERGGDRDVELGLPTLLISGETGAGKEFIFNNLFSLLSERYRKHGGSRDFPLRKTNIAAYSGELTYTELFGHRKGAYTGAHLDRQGILEEADGGVVFLDEIADADLKTQVQLLRFLDSGEFTRLGENRIRRSRVVLVAATNRDLQQEISLGNFREDLFHRLREIVLHVPSLRERREDIPDLAKHFLGRLHATYDPGGPAPQLKPEAAVLLAELDYPGNIRQLVGILQGALFESEGGVVGEPEVSRALSIFREVEEPSAGDTSALYARLRSGRGDFWTLVHAPFMEHEMTRSEVIRVYRTALAEGGGVREAARLLGAIPAEGEGGRDLTRFRNFMYKTVGASRGEASGPERK